MTIVAGKQLKELMDKQQHSQDTSTVDGEDYELEEEEENEVKTKKSKSST